MRVMVIIQATPNSESNVMPSEELLTAMGNYNEALVKAGIMLSGEGLLPSSKGKRLVIEGGVQQIIDGPFTESKELVAGFWMWKVKDMDEAVAWARKCPDPMPGERAVLELRQIGEMEDFGAEFTPELRAQEDRLREELEAQKKG